jgi:hypothetical protein
MGKLKFALPLAMFVVLVITIPNVQAGSAPPGWMALYEQAQQGLPPTVAAAIRY